MSNQLQLIEVKAKQKREELGKEEKSIPSATEEMEFDVPQTIATYLHQVGLFSDKMGKTTDLDVLPLPTARA